MRMRISTLRSLLAFISLRTLVFGEDIVSELPDAVTDENPVRLFIQSGQSECVGQASARLLNLDSETYPDLVDEIEGAWLAGEYNGKGNILIRPMVAGEFNDKKFGPEAPISQRIVEARTESSSPIMIVKYCWGGTNIREHWNPTTSKNNWDREKDDGTSTWLSDNGVTDFDSKDKLYANLMYVVRKTTELLDDAAIPYEYSGFFWLQGSGDKEHVTWDEYADYTILLFETLRSDLNEPSLPIVDQGASAQHNIATGKEYAADTIENGNVYTAEFGAFAANPDDCCIPSASNACPGVTFLNIDVFEHYGYDPAFTDDMKPEGFTDKDFYWYKDYPNNQHSEYEAMILWGRLMANTFLRQVEPEWANLTAAMEENDAKVLFPFEPCPEGEKPTNDNVCWMDQSKNTTPVVELECESEGGGSLIDMLIQFFLGILRFIFGFLG